MFLRKDPVVFYLQPKSKLAHEFVISILSLTFWFSSLGWGGVAHLKMLWVTLCSVLWDYTWQAWGPYVVSGIETRLTCARQVYYLSSPSFFTFIWTPNNGNTTQGLLILDVVEWEGKLKVKGFGWHCFFFFFRVAKYLGWREEEEHLKPNGRDSHTSRKLASSAESASLPEGEAPWEQQQRPISIQVSSSTL